MQTVQCTYLLQEREESERDTEGEARDDDQWEGGETDGGVHPAPGLLLPPEHQALTNPSKTEDWISYNQQRQNHYIYIWLKQFIGYLLYFIICNTTP